jgi:hypothetical protein
VRHALGDDEVLRVLGEERLDGGGVARDRAERLAERVGLGLPLLVLGAEPLVELREDGLVAGVIGELLGRPRRAAAMTAGVGSRWRRTTSWWISAAWMSVLRTIAVKPCV